MHTALGAVRRFAPHPALALIALLAVAPGAAGQAWTPPAGAGALTFSIQTINNTGHLLTDGSVLKGYDSKSASLQVDFDYALTDRFSVSASIPYVFAKYTGPAPSFSGLPVDECHCWNHGWQDFGFTARYRITGGALAVTPSMSVGVPSHGYANVGEAVLGRNLREWRLAVDVGERLDVISSRLSVAARYAYSAPERVLDYGTERSNTNFEGAFQATRRLSVRAGVSWQRTHGGLRALDFDTPEKLQQYDRLIRDNNWKAGGGLSYSLPSVDVFGAVVRYMGGSDTHTGYAITFGVSVPFEAR